MSGKKQSKKMDLEDQDDQIDPSPPPITKAKKTKKAQSFDCECGRTLRTQLALANHRKLKHDLQDEEEETEVKKDEEEEINCIVISSNPKLKKKKSLIVEYKEKPSVNVKDKSSKLCIENVREYLQGLEKSVVQEEPSKKKTKRKSKSKEVDVIEEIGEDSGKEVDPVGDFPVELFQDKKEFHDVLMELKAIGEKGVLAEEEYDVENDIKKTKLDVVMALFLREIARLANREIYREIAVFVILYRMTLNENGWQLVHQGNKDAKKEKFCSKNNAQFVLEVCNEVIQNTLMEQAKSIDLTKLKYIGFSDSHVGHMINFTKVFGYWLFSNYYTNKRIEVCLEGYERQENDFIY